MAGQLDEPGLCGRVVEVLTVVGSGACGMHASVFGRTARDKGFRSRTRVGGTETRRWKVGTPAGADSKAKHKFPRTKRQTPAQAGPNWALEGDRG